MNVKLELCDWSDTLGLDDPEECVRVLNERLWIMFDESFPLIRVKVSSRDLPFMSPLVKHLCNIRNKRSHTCSVAKNITRQGRINSLISWNQVKAVNNESKEHVRGSKGWWDIANTITKRKTQGISVSAVIRPDVINTYFQLDCLQSAFSLKIRLVLISASAIANQDVMLQ